MTVSYKWTEYKILTILENVFKKELLALREGRGDFKIVFVMTMYKILFQKPFPEVSINGVI